MKNLLSLVQKLERGWYRDFKAELFEDVDILVYDEDGEATEEIDTNELESHLIDMIEYTEDREAEEIELKDFELADTFHYWNNELREALKEL